MTQIQKKSDEEILFPEVILGKFIISPWSFHKLLYISPYLEKVIDKFKENNLHIEINNKSISYVSIAKLFSILTEDILNIISLTLDNIPIKELKKLELIIGFKLLTIIFIQNKDIIENRQEIAKDKKEPKVDKKRAKEHRELTLSEIFQTLVSNNHPINDIINKYTIDQVYLFYENCKKIEMDSNRMDAIILANALVYTSPSSDKSSVNSKQQTWEKFLDTLSWGSKVNSKKKRRVVNPIASLQRMGVPLMGKLPEKKEEMNE